MQAKLAGMSMRIDIWSDIACPWCFVGKRRMEAALADFPHKDEVQIVWRAFELDPSAPKVLSGEVSYAERLARKYRTSAAQGEAMCQRMTATAAEDGLSFRFDRIRPGNTFDAHRLLHLAGERGCQDALKERLLSAYLEQGQAIGDGAVLARCAAEVGLDEEEVQALLAGDRFADEVRQDEATARSLRVTGVPFFVFDGRIGVSGAQPAELLREVLDKAWAQHTPALETVAGTDGAACGPEGCAVPAAEPATGTAP